MFEVILVEPQIPPNTGNVARLCAATRTPLRLVEPLGFEITSSRLKRAGLDYWEFAEVTTHTCLDHLIEREDRDRLCFFSKKASQSYLDARFKGDEKLIFGSETEGLSQAILDRYPDRCFRIPMLHPSVRSLNLANAVSIVLYEGLRQSRAIS